MAKMQMDVVHPHAASIDIGSRSHFVAVGQGEKDVREFGVYADDLVSICQHLKQHRITHVAMESTGSYWQNLYVELCKHGFDVTLCNGKFTKNIRGKKTDVKDARWIQKLHSIGLLSGSFLPDETTETLRTYCRQRTNWTKAKRRSHAQDAEVPQAAQFQIRCSGKRCVRPYRAGYH